MAEAALAADWREEELAHLAACRSCQRLVEAEYRLECPDLTILARYAAGLSPFEEALRRHLEEDLCERCRRRLEAAWTKAAAARLRAGSLTEAAFREMGLGIAEASLRGLSASPSFLPSSGSADMQQVHAAGPEGLLALTMRQEGPRVVVYVESPSAALAGRAVDVEVLGSEQRLQARLVLGFVEGAGAFGRHDLGLFADFLSRIGRDCEILVSLVVR
jgi:hypothetical protein